MAKPSVCRNCGEHIRWVCLDCSSPAWSCDCPSKGNRARMRPMMFFEGRASTFIHRCGGYTQPVSEPEPEPMPQPEPEPVAQPPSNNRELWQAVDRIDKAVRDLDTRMHDDDDISERIARIAAGILASSQPIEVKRPDGTVKNVGRQHAQFATALQYLGLQLNVFLVGSAGTGKTSAAKAMAEALDVPYYSIPLGPQTSKSDLLGFIAGTGSYVASLLRQAYEQGGVILFDEMDAANPATLTIINSLLANAIAGFADTMVERHPQCYFLAAGNTYGKGANRLFTGRAQLDAATLDRWVYVNWDADWDFVESLSGNREWTRYVQRLHERASELDMRVIIGPRAALDGATMLAAGIPREQVEQARIWASISADDKSKLLAGVR